LKWITIVDFRKIEFRCRETTLHDCPSVMATKNQSLRVDRLNNETVLDLLAVKIHVKIHAARCSAIANEGLRVSSDCAWPCAYSRMMLAVFLILIIVWSTLLPLALASGNPSLRTDLTWGVSTADSSHGPDSPPVPVTLQGVFKAWYTIYNPNSQSATVILGLSIVDSRGNTWDSAVSHDDSCTLVSLGTTLCGRLFVVPSSAATGTASVVFGIWKDLTFCGTCKYDGATKSSALTVYSSFSLTLSSSTTDGKSNVGTMWIGQSGSGTTYNLPTTVQVRSDHYVVSISPPGGYIISTWGKSGSIGLYDMGGGSAAIDVDANNGGVNAVLKPGPDFSIGVGSSALTVDPGGTVSTFVTVYSNNGFSGTVSLNAGFDPGPIPWDWVQSLGFSSNPLSVNVPSGGSAGGTFSITVKSDAPGGDYGLIITGTGPGGTGGITRSKSLQLHVNRPQYTITVNTVPSGVGTPSGGGTYSQGQTITISVSNIDPNAYTLQKWQRDGQDYSPAGTGLSFQYQVDASRTFTAIFTSKTTSLGLLDVKIDSVQLDTNPNTNTKTYQISVDGTCPSSHSNCQIAAVVVYVTDSNTALNHNSYTISLTKNGNPYQISDPLLTGSSTGTHQSSGQNAAFIVQNGYPARYEMPLEKGQYVLTVTCTHMGLLASKNAEIGVLVSYVTSKQAEARYKLYQDMAYSWRDPKRQQAVSVIGFLTGVPTSLQDELQLTGETIFDFFAATNPYLGAIKDVYDIAVKIRDADKFQAEFQDYQHRRMDWENFVDGGYGFEPNFYSSQTISSSDMLSFYTRIGYRVWDSSQNAWDGQMSNYVDPYFAGSYDCVILVGYCPPSPNINYYPTFISTETGAISFEYYKIWKDLDAQNSAGYTDAVQRMKDLKELLTYVKWIPGQMHEISNSPVSQWQACQQVNGQTDCFYQNVAGVTGGLISADISLYGIQIPPPTVQYPLHIIVAGDGGTTNPIPGTYQRNSGDSVSISYSTSGGSFSGWIVAGGVSCSGGSMSNPCTFTMPSSAVSVTANFNPPSGTFNANDASFSASVSGPAIQSSLGYSNTLGENVVIYFIITDASGNVVDTPSATALNGQSGTASATSKSLNSATYYVSWIASRVSDTSLSNPLDWSTTSERMTVTINAATYSVTFSQNIIPSGVSWGVTVAGTDHTGSGSSIVVSGLTGSPSYRYDSPVSVSGGSYVCTSSNCSGSLSSSTGSVSATYTIQIPPGPQILTTGVDSGQGSVSPACTGGCSETVGSSQTVTANPSTGWQFSSWSTQSGQSCSSNPCVFTMPNNAVTLKATFTQIPSTCSSPVTIDGVQWSYATAGSGFYSGYPKCSTGISLGYTAFYLDTPGNAEGYFQKQFLVPTASPTFAAWIWGEYDPVTVTITVITSGGSTIQLDSFTPNQVLNGQTQDSPRSYSLSSWAGQTVTIRIDQKSSGGTGTIAHYKNLEVTTQLAQTLTTGVDSGSGSVTPNCPGPSGCSEGVGSSVTVTAMPGSGWQFSSWSTQTGISCSTNPCVFTMPDTAVTLGATFSVISPSTQTLTTSIQGSGWLSPNCPSGCSEAVGSSISMLAAPSQPGWSFAGWIVTGASCSGGSSSNPCAFTMPSNAVTVSAIFIPTTGLSSTVKATVGETMLDVFQVTGATSSGPHGDQSTGSTTFANSMESVAVTGNGVQQYLVLATSQVWNAVPTVGASMAVCKDGSLISGDMFSLGAIAAHRHLATAAALDTPGTGSHTYTLCYKTDPGGTAFVSGTMLIVVPVSGAYASGPTGDQSTTSTTFTDSAQTIVINQGGNQQYLLLATSQLWDNLPNVGASIAVCRDGAQISGDMYGVGATLGHRNLATAVSLDTPTPGQHTYSLCFKTDDLGVGFVSGTFLILVPAAGALQSGPWGDQLTSSTSFVSSLQYLPVTASGSQQYVAIATSQLWDTYASTGASMAVCMDGSRISGDMYSVGAIGTHRHLATAIALNTPPSGSHTYSLCYKTDPGTGSSSPTLSLTNPISSQILAETFPQTARFKERN
jgi:hypothetical protein